jgi:hypothetical protein
MCKYRVEFVDPVENSLCLVAVFDTRQEAQQELRQEWRRWKQLISRNGFRHILAELNADHFTIQTPSGQSIVYRVESGHPSVVARLPR